MKKYVKPNMDYLVLCPNENVAFIDFSDLEQQKEEASKNISSYLSTSGKSYEA